MCMVSMLPQLLAQCRTESGQVILGYEKSTASVVVTAEWLVFFGLVLGKSWSSLPEESFHYELSRCTMHPS